MPPDALPWKSRALALVFAGQFAVVDVALRGARGYAHHPDALVGALVSVLLSLVLFSVCSPHRVTRAALAAFAAAVVVLDGFVYRYYGTLFDVQVLGSALVGWADVRPIVVRLLPALGLFAVAFALEYACLARGSLPAAPRTSAALGVASLVGLVATPTASLTPELRALAASSLLFTKQGASVTATARVPVLPSSRDEVPSVLLVLTESVRASSYCSERRDDCAFSPEVNALFPGRVPLTELRSLASYTALSVASLLTGKPLAGAPEPADHTAPPTLFDYVRATRVEGRAPWVGYWSAQAASVTHRDLTGSVDSLVTMETLLGHGFDDEDDAVELDMDRRIADRCVAELPSVPRPFFLMLHLLGTHTPYFMDPARAPFQPTSQVVTWAGMPDLVHAYQDAIVAQDHTLATCLRAFVKQQGSAPWIIVFTSDHGEAFGEHGGIHHGQSLYDEQVHVPGWVATSDNALDRTQEANLRAHARAFVTHLDILPTVLDAFGVWDGVAMAGLRARAKLSGRSLLAPVTPAPPVPVTNCTSLFPCPLNTWGMLGEGSALIAQAWDGEWKCINLATGKEHGDREACAPLRAASHDYFPLLPGGQVNR